MHRVVQRDWGVATPTETETVAIGMRRLVSDLFRALALAIANENLQCCRFSIPVANAHS